MLVFLTIIFLSISPIYTIDYNISNVQTCTRQPFVANFFHNCSRTRLTSDVTIPNRNDILFITIIFRPKLSISDNSLSIQLMKNLTTSLTFIKSSTLNQKIYLTFFTDNERLMSINNHTKLSFNESTIHSYFYNTSTEEISSWKNPVDINASSICIMKQANFPPDGFTRAYYLYTNETNLIIDLSKSSYYITPLFTSFQACFREKSNITSTGIVFIVLICVFSVIALVLLAFCLRKQLKELYYILRNLCNRRAGKVPITVNRQ